MFNDATTIYRNNQLWVVGIRLQSYKHVGVYSHLIQWDSHFLEATGLLIRILKLFCRKTCEIFFTL